MKSYYILTINISDLYCSHSYVVAGWSHCALTCSGLEATLPKCPQRPLQPMRRGKRQLPSSQLCLPVDPLTTPTATDFSNACSEPSKLHPSVIQICSLKSSITIFITMKTIALSFKWDIWAGLSLLSMSNLDRRATSSQTQLRRHTTGTLWST